MSPRIDWQKYILAFLITAAIFGTAIYVSRLFDARRIADIQNIQEKISLDILSLETQLDLLAELSCEDIEKRTVLTSELNSLAERLSFAEESLGANNEAVANLKRQYSLLQIKDYLLLKRVTEKCQTKPVFILYFYSNAGDCPDCEREGYVLTYFREQYPQLRVYAFDYHLDLPALQTLVAINKAGPVLPGLVISGKLYDGYQDREAIERILPELAQFETLEASTSTDTR